MHLSKLIDDVRKAWTWDKERYPGLEEPHLNRGSLDGDRRSRFQRKHVLLHMMKQLGELSGAEEGCDHDPRNGFGARELQRHAALGKLLVDVLQFAAVEGLTEDNLLAAFHKALRKDGGSDDPHHEAAAYGG